MQKNKKTEGKTSPFIHTEVYIKKYYIHNLHASSVEKNTQKYPTDKVCTYCSMNQQYVKGVQKRKKAYLGLWDRLLQS